MKKILILIIATALSVVSFELFLRFSPFEYGLSPVEYDNTIGMWHKRNYSEYKISKCYRTKYEFDNNGLPKNIYSYNKKNKDIVILGDSFIEALMVKNENIIHNSLAKEYKNQYNFLNYGLSGTSPTQQFIILKEKVNLSNVKYIIQFISIQGDLMDVDPKNLDSFNRPKVYVKFSSLYNYTIIPPRKLTLYDKIADFMGNFQLYTFIKKALYYLRDNVLFKKHTTDTKEKLLNDINQIDLSKNWLYLKGAIFQINKIALENNIIYKPIIISKNNDNINIMKSFLKFYHIPYIILNEEINFDLSGFSCDGHWNDKTHQNIAKYLKNINFFE